MGYHGNKIGISVFQMQVMAEYTHTIGFTVTAFHSFNVTNQNPLKSVEEA
tara:strand:+ start:201 stop:350 length:150 start_codon:yes stop_codon:yes gene_type:complete